MEMDEIAKLTTVLRESGDEVLNGFSKLTLSADLLNNVNNSFSLVIDQRDVMNSSFHVINNSNTKLEVFRDLQFLHDFMQRTVSLKLTPASVTQRFSETIEITKFKNLKLLEVHKISIKSIFGLQGLRGQLQYIICLRSINTINDVLEYCGGDDSQGFIWTDLKEVVFSHNSLTNIDNSFEFTPSLHTLDLSHNDIEDASALNCLTNLKHLNIGYNKLNNIPLFSEPLSNRLQVLVIRNNFIEDINEISGLSNLCELDLSENCLIEHNSLVPLSNLATLQWLNLDGNPLGYHPQHRCRTSSYLHANTGTVRFLLDKVVLNKNEQRLVGSLHPRVIQRPVSNVSSFTNSEITVPDKPKRIRNAIISNTEHSPIIQSFASASSLITSADHLETKRQIEQLREQYGEKWLHSQAGSLVQDALGLERTPLTLSSTPYEADILIHAEIHPIDRHEYIKSEQTIGAYVTASESIQDNSMYANEVFEAPETISDDDDLGEESLYLATIKGETEPVFLVITETHLIERECTSTKERTRWPIATLITCESFDSDPPYIQINFDTLKNDRKQRQYHLDDKEEAIRFKIVLQTIINNKPPEKNQLIIFKCMKCSTQFGIEKNKRLHDSSTVECTSCHSSMVFEVDG